MNIIGFLIATSEFGSFIWQVVLPSLIICPLVWVGGKALYAHEKILTKREEDKKLWALRQQYIDEERSRELHEWFDEQ